MAAVAVPNFRQSYAQLKLKQAADQMSYLMRYIQTRAINRNLAAGLEFDDEHKSYWFVEEEAQDSEGAEQERSSGV